MLSKELEVGFSPPEKKEAVDERVGLILDLIKQRGCSYPAEICGELDISKDTVYRKCRFLERQGVIKRMSLAGIEHVPGWLKPRINELWARGIKGEKIRRITWYVLVKAGGKNVKKTA